MIAFLKHQSKFLILLKYYFIKLQEQNNVLINNDGLFLNLKILSKGQDVSTK